MEMVANSYMPTDQRLVDKIVYELKSQGIFDQFRKECFADVDTKPAYQNLRQRVEGSVSSFLKDQSWKPDMNKNQVREMLRKKISESGYLETGVERIVDQVVNPKINSIFLPKVEEVVYSYLGIKKPGVECKDENPPDLLPTELEAVSPEPLDKKEEKSEDMVQENQDLDDSKTEEDESPPFEPLDEPPAYMHQEENSIDSHLSGFSVGHESNHSADNKALEQDSQTSRNSSDGHLSIITSDENSKMDICEDSSQSKSVKSVDFGKNEDKNRNKSDKSRSLDKNKSKNDSKSDTRDRKSSSSSSRHGSSKDKDRNRDRKDSKSSSSNRDKDRSKEKSDRDRKSSSSSTKHSSNKDRNSSKSSLKSDKDYNKNRSSSHKDSKSRDYKSKSSEKHRHSSSHNEKYNKKDNNKEKKREKSKDDHYSSKEKKDNRRSTDRDSNDGSSKHSTNSINHETNASTTSQKNSHVTTNNKNSGGSVDQSDSCKQFFGENNEKVKILKPKCASNMQEALKLMKIRKQLAKLEKQNQLSVLSEPQGSQIDETASTVEETEVSKSDREDVRHTVISQDSWDAMEAKLRVEISSEFPKNEEELISDEIFEEKPVKNESIREEDECKYFEAIDTEKISFLRFTNDYLQKLKDKKQSRKRKFSETNNNKSHEMLEKKKKMTVLNKSIIEVSNENFSLPLSPAESEKSNEVVIKPKRNNIANTQRYSSDDLYKPRPVFASSRRRGAQKPDN